MDIVASSCISSKSKLDLVSPFIVAATEIVLQFEWMYKHQYQIICDQNDIASTTILLSLETKLTESNENIADQHAILEYKMARLRDIITRFDSFDTSIPN